MRVDEAAKQRIEQLEGLQANLTMIRTLANEIGKSQELAEALWRNGAMKPRLLALLVMELKAVDNDYVETLIQDIERAAEQEQRQLVDWLVPNVLMKKAALKKAASDWLSEASVIKQRIFWSIQARTIKAENKAFNTHLLAAIEKQMAHAPAMVQEHMNWCAAQIGIADEDLRARCIQLGETLGLYKDYPVSKGCTSPYLPIWIESVVGKQREAS